MPLCSEMVHFIGFVSRPRLRTGHLRSVSGSVSSARDAGQTALFIHHQSLHVCSVGKDSAVIQFL